MASFLPFGDGDEYRLLKTPAALWVTSPPSLPEVPPFSATKVWQPGPPSGPGKAGGPVPRAPRQRLSVPDVKLVRRIRAEPHASSSRLFIIVLCSRVGEGVRSSLLEVKEVQGDHLGPGFSSLRNVRVRDSSRPHPHLPMNGRTASCSHHTEASGRAPEGRGSWSHLAPNADLNPIKCLVPPPLAGTTGTEEQGEGTWGCSQPAPGAGNC
ncbi:PREDICTED: uncharacterized protein LOC102244573 [Myotis brandtii]|uniref:uncharacterized protein LOC102244573 n=1 Tax=Myotis brandtii TaxID=109478 RepID=UPI0003BBEB75|nr:PREDICTED: uncharacterized protein LOC102244573 [Myotis brandtii]